jgi:hypothetical protein
MPVPLQLNQQNQKKGAGMRTKHSNQMYLNFSGMSTLKVVKEYRQRYGAIAGMLDENPGILAAAQRDLARNLS